MSLRQQVARSGPLVKVSPVPSHRTCGAQLCQEHSPSNNKHLSRMMLSVSLTFEDNCPILGGEGGSAPTSQIGRLWGGIHLQVADQDRAPVGRGLTPLAPGGGLPCDGIPRPESRNQPETELLMTLSLLRGLGHTASSKEPPQILPATLIFCPPRLPSAPEPCMRESEPASSKSRATS